jgi:hypothetical protein
VAEAQRISAPVRQLFADRASQLCEYRQSQQRYSPDPYSAEHIVPRSLGGSSDPQNLAWSCLGCNGHKYTSAAAADPATGSEFPLFNPRSDRWSDHFAWSSDVAHVVGISPTGRATVDKLQLNRPGVVELRRVLRSAGRHPPM